MKIQTAGNQLLDLGLDSVKQHLLHVDDTHNFGLEMREKLDQHPLTGSIVDEAVLCEDLYGPEGDVRPLAIPFPLFSSRLVIPPTKIS